MRIFVDPEMINDKFVTITDKGDIHHITRVMRLTEGAHIDVSDKTMWEYECEIDSILNDEIVARIISKNKFEREPETLITLYQGIPKAGKMEGIIQKSVELGVHEIVPFWSERTVVTDKGKFDKKIERWQKISDEAVKQCKRGIIPEVLPDVKLKDLVKNLINGDVKYDLTLLAYENELGTTIKDHIESLDEKPHTVSVIIGPEGGISESEAKALVDAGAVSVSLGKTILRTETAGPATIAMLMYALEL
ncbi:MAG: 16S rRNA (uracil(1498)-N(3))-methyltransferase [Firmicutes bacterium]|nr:16S rRNA (uracil(1498)-N(3))-methyltransferase [Bacillota bacterium]